MRQHLFLSLLTTAVVSYAQDLRLNSLEYFERQGVNVLVFSNSFNGGFNDEKNSGIEVVHHGVRTVQGGAVRLNNTPEQWDLVPTMTNRKVDRENGSIVKIPVKRETRKTRKKLGRFSRTALTPITKYIYELKMIEKN